MPDLPRRTDSVRARARRRFAEAGAEPGHAATLMITRDVCEQDRTRQFRERGWLPRVQAPKSEQVYRTAVAVIICIMLCGESDNFNGVFRPSVITPLMYVHTYLGVYVMYV